MCCRLDALSALEPDEDEDGDDAASAAGLGANEPTARRGWNPDNLTATAGSASGGSASKARGAGKKVAAGAAKQRTEDDGAPDAAAQDDDEEEDEEEERPVRSKGLLRARTRAVRRPALGRRRPATVVDDSE